MRESSKPNRRWKKWNVLVTAISCGGLLLGGILFSALVVNPWEGAYPHSLWYLTPSDMDAVFYLPEGRAKWENFQQSSFYRRLRRNPNLRQFLQSPLYRQTLQQQGVEAGWKSLYKLDAQSPIDLFSEENILKLLGEEVLLAVRLDPHHPVPGVLILTRVSFRFKVAEALLPTILARATQGKIQVPLRDGIKEVTLPQLGTYYLARVRDILLLANEAGLITQSLRLSRENPAEPSALISLGSGYAQDLPSSLEAHEAFLFNNWQTMRTRFAQAGVKLSLSSSTPYSYLELVWGDVLDLAALDRLTARISFAEITELAYSLHGAAEGSRSLYRKANRQTSGDWPVLGWLAKRSFAYRTVTISPNDYWDVLFRRLEKGWQPEVEYARSQLQQANQGKDVLTQDLLPLLRGEVIVAASTIDFASEGLSPRDREPALTVLLQVQEGQNLLPLFNKLLPQPGLRIPLEEVRYAELPILRLRLPDTSGGARQPAIAQVGSYLVMTSHLACLKNIIDAKDHIAERLLEQTIHRQFAPFLSANTFRAFLDADGLLDVAQDLHVNWAEEKAINAFRRNPAGPNVSERQKMLQEEMAQWLQLARVLRLSAAMTLEDHPGGPVQGKVMVWVGNR